MCINTKSCPLSEGKTTNKYTVYDNILKHNVLYESPVIGQNYDYSVKLHIFTLIYIPCYIYHVVYLCMVQHGIDHIFHIFLLC